MSRGAWWLLFGSRLVGVIAVLVSIVVGLYITLMSVAFVCFDTCSTPDFYAAHYLLAPPAAQVVCAALASLSFLLFLGYCFVARQPRLIIPPALILVVGGVVAAAALWAFMLYGQSGLPVTSDGLLVESAVESWQRTWSLTVMAVAMVWSGVLVYLQRAGM